MTNNRLLVAIAAILAVLIVGSAWLNTAQRQDLRQHSDGRWSDLKAEIAALSKQCGRK